MPPHHYSPHLRNRWQTLTSGFSLIELCIVIAMFAILVGLVTPALRGPLDGSNLAGAANTVDSKLALARQLSVSKNLPVEVRFYKSDDLAEEHWRIVALVIPSEISGNARDEWLEPGKLLPGNVVFSDQKDYSTIITDSAPLSGTEDSTAPGMLKGKQFAGFSFRPDGSTDLPANRPSCITLKSAFSQPTDDRPASNYVTIVLDSLTGRTLVYQP